MSYRVFARKYRPQTFEEVVGQEHITRTLQNAIREDRLAQAYLFVGPRGIGKTSTARILAKALNCLKGPSPSPCNQCSNCLEISEGNNLDVLEIDGASNNSVEHVRDLRDNVAYSPTSGKFKIYLVDEVHMLSTAAFNALLKTLEEPPSHVKFIFATTEAQKVPATITSRCQRFDLRRIPATLISGHLQTIAEAEKISLDPEASAAIARAADGGLRDAESMLDQVVAFCGDRITGKDVMDVFGFTPRDTVAGMAGHLLRLETAQVLALAASQAHAGKDLSNLVEELISWFRDLLVFQVTQTSSDESMRELLQAQSAMVSREKLLVLLEHLAAAEGRLRWAPDKHLQLDVALIKAAHLLDEASLSEVIETLADLCDGKTPRLPERRAAVPAPQAPPPTVVVAPAAPLPPVSAPPAPAAPPKPALDLAFDSPSQPDPAPVSAPSSSVIPAGSGALTDHEKWLQAVAQLMTKSPLKGRLLELARFVSAKPGVVTVAVPESQYGEVDSFMWLDIRKTVEASLTVVFGVKTQLAFESFADEVVEESEPEPEAPPAPAENQSAEPAAPEAPPEPSADAMEEFKNDPRIQEALALFKAELLNSSTT